MLRSSNGFFNKSNSNLVCVCFILISVLVNFNVGSEEESPWKINPMLWTTVSTSKPSIGKSILNLFRLGVRNIVTYTQRKMQTRTIVQRFLNHPFYNESKRVAIFLNRPDEVKTRKLIRLILKSGRKVFLPWYEANSSSMKLLQMINIYDIKRYTKENKDGILQFTNPENRTEAMESGGLDLVVLPGMAFSLDGKRLGRGNNDLYPNYLNELKKMSPHYRTMGLAFKCQVVYDFPLYNNCIVVDHIVHSYKVYNPAAQIIDLIDPFGNHTHYNEYLKFKPRNSSIPRIKNATMKRLYKKYKKAKNKKATNKTKKNKKSKKKKSKNNTNNKKPKSG
uniref:5-formyltetrahydrofolate cyclo-ligase n=1 Tax=Cacopsylla melanoneura TaxID=428564 RepID=A0A8D8WNQ1_9HEMI